MALAAYLLPTWNSTPDPQALTTQQQTQQEPVRPLPQLPADVRELFDTARPAVVRIGSLDPAAMKMGLGTGFFIDSDGTMLTAYHVVSEGQLFLAETLEGERYPVKLVAFDAASDVALLEMSRDNKGPFPYLELAPQPPTVGDAVMAIGNSGGDFLQPRRGLLLRLDTPSARADFPQGTLEMDAQLAPGDSGGPILGADGRALGVVSYIRVDDAGNTMASYAVPTPAGSPLMQALKSGERKDRAVAGLVFDLLHDGVTDPPGAIVSAVVPGSPAEQAGLLGSKRDETGNLVDFGDVILKVGDERTRNAGDVLREMSRYSVGDTVTLQYQRGDAQYKTDVVLAARRSLRQ